MHRRLRSRPVSRTISSLAAVFSTFVVAASLVGLVVCSGTAKAQIEVMDPLAPRKGELVVVGKVLAAMTKERRIALSVTQVTTADGATIDLHPPVSKTIMLSSATSYRIMSDASQKVTLSDIRPNAVVRAVGITKGPGTPLAARAVGIEADANFDQQSLWQTMPPTQEDSWWQFRAKDPAEAHTFIEDKAFKVTVVRPTATASDVQVIQGGMKMQNGQKWHLHFRAKASPARRVKLSAIVRGGDFHGIGLREEIRVEPEWRDYDYTFTASKVSEEEGQNQFPSISFGDKVGTVWIIGMQVEEFKEAKAIKSNTNNTNTVPQEGAKESGKSGPK